MAESLKVAAETGDINGLYGSIKEDSHVLDRIDVIPFVDTPLHTAASAGHTDFAIEILRLKPSFGRKLNPDGLSSLHLALINDKFETVKRLIKFDKELIRVKGREGANSLRWIAVNDNNADQQQIVAGRINILVEFLFACPNSIEDLTIRDETALHIALKTKNQRAVHVILGYISSIGREKVLDYVNVEGNDALYMAKSTSQHVIACSLCCAGASSMWCIQIVRSLCYAPIQIVRSLCCAGALECSFSDPSDLAEFLKSPERPLEVVYKHIIRVRRSVSMELRNIGLVVAVLIATATFQAVLSPPGGVGGPGNNNLLTNGTSINATNHLFAANTSFINATFFIPTTDDPVERLTYEYFYEYNTVAFVLSMLMIIFILPFQPFFPLHFALYFLMLSYGTSSSVISPWKGSFVAFLTVSIVCALLMNFCRVLIYRICHPRKARNKRLWMLERLLNNAEQ